MPGWRLRDLIQVKLSRSHRRLFRCRGAKVQFAAGGWPRQAARETELLRNSDVRLEASCLIPLGAVQVRRRFAQQSGQPVRWQRRAECAMHHGHRNIMQVIRVVVGAVQVDPVAGRAGIMRRIHIAPHVPGHPHGCFHAEIGKISRNDQPLKSRAAQLDLKRCARESRIDILAHDNVVRFGLQPLRLFAGLQREFQRAAGLQAVMPGEGHHAPRRPERPEQRHQPRLTGRIVHPPGRTAPVVGHMTPLLNVDQKKRGAGPGLPDHFRYPLWPGVSRRYQPAYRDEVNAMRRNMSGGVSRVWGRHARSVIACAAAGALCRCAHIRNILFGLSIASCPSCAVRRRASICRVSCGDVRSLT